MISEAEMRGNKMYRVGHNRAAWTSFYPQTGQFYVNIREVRKDLAGNLVGSKVKGINLNLDGWALLKEAVPYLDKDLKALKGDDGDDGEFIDDNINIVENKESMSKNLIAIDFQKPATAVKNKNKYAEESNKKNKRKRVQPLKIAPYDAGASFYTPSKMENVFDVTPGRELGKNQDDGNAEENNEIDYSQMLSEAYL